MVICAIFATRSIQFRHQRLILRPAQEDRSAGIWRCRQRSSLLPAGVYARTSRPPALADSHHALIDHWVELRCRVSSHAWNGNPRLPDAAAALRYSSPLPLEAAQSPPPAPCMAQALLSDGQRVRAMDTPVVYQGQYIRSPSEIPLSGMETDNVAQSYHPVILRASFCSRVVVPRTA